MKSRKNYCAVDIAGKRFGNLVALKKIDGKRTEWLFQCDCGKQIPLKISRVFGGQISCGCVREKTAREWVASHITHGGSKTKLYRKYRSILDRCYNDASWKYKRYGGRGIYVCDEWKNSFEAFRKWAYETGYNPDLDGNREQSIDRIDNDGPYSPDNCKWSTAAEQQKNRECTKLYPYKDKLYSASEFADKFGITDKSFVYRRLAVNGQTLEYILDDWECIHNIPDYLMEVQDFASLRGVTPAHIKRLINTGAIDGEKVGRKWYVKKSELEKIKQ